ncbi:MAG: M23 family metallopeptidase [Alphaproteobacteria bacterium]|nr:M23 family metallopeptidase [Alphaproteobacteria bacterium]
MDLSRFSKQFRVLGGGVLLVFAYSPMLWDLSSDRNALFDEGKIVLSRSDSVLDGRPIFQARLTDSLISGYFGKDKLLSFDIMGLKSSQVTGVDSETRSTEVSRFAEIKTGPYKGGKLIKGTIHSNFYVDARNLSIPVRVIDKVIKSLSSKIDFRRSLKKGDQFEIAFDSKNELIYSKIKTRRRQASVYKFGKEGYFFENGEKVGGAQSGGSFAAPIRGKMRVSSPFGLRVHPVTKRYKRHAGVDLIAGYGTPIYAIYDGIVTRASRYSGYGKCVDIKHKNGYTSRYAHLSRYAVRSGARVKKGQLIAYSGSSGVATGPHLHLELARNRVNLNPMRVKMIVADNPKRVSSKARFSSLKNYFSKLSDSVK